ncbi:hypothetical protein DL96DRAFT_1181213 [Flagelloscypha sp. PMI_526]|nr:hypothetical protein DL96DRAFT_1181213 [Flagelloscypha sp. PMI_526]
MFGKRGNLPPSSFSANTLTPNSQTNGNNRRFSGIDFECVLFCCCFCYSKRRLLILTLDREALLKDTTFRFNESVDVNQLGVGLDNSFDSLGTPTKGPPPGMNIVPPTPSPNGKRVSVYRQTGFASSPDLASLLKSKKQPAPPLPTSSSPSGSPRKGTIRTKTSGFLGKFLNHGSVRERSKTDATHPSIDSLSSVPPVPPIPRTMTTSPSPGSTSPIADAFSRFPESKPLPPIMLSPVARDEDDDSSIVMVSRPSRSPSPAAGASSTSKANKRRSMSAGDTDLESSDSILLLSGVSHPSLRP